jgi:hypothetical protein
MLAKKAPWQNTRLVWLYFNVGFVGRFIARTPANGAERTSRF